MFPRISLVLGGISSGKSAFAETLVLSGGRKPVYLASAQPDDDEMKDKIAAHRQSRGDGWFTIEEPLQVARVLGERAEDEIVLFDCATLWLTNHMLANHDLQSQVGELMGALATCACPVVIVSNEVGSGGISTNALQRQFQKAQGGLNRDLARTADLAVLVVAGLPMLLKGAIPGKVQ